MTFFCCSLSSIRVKFYKTWKTHLYGTDCFCCLELEILTVENSKLLTTAENNDRLSHVKKTPSSLVTTKIHTNIILLCTYYNNLILECTLLFSKFNFIDNTIK